MIWQITSTISNPFDFNQMFDMFEFGIAGNDHGIILAFFFAKIALPFFQELICQ